MQDWMMLLPMMVVMTVAMICSTFLIVDHFIVLTDLVVVVNCRTQMTRIYTDLKKKRENPSQVL